MTRKIVWGGQRDKIRQTESSGQDSTGGRKRSTREKEQDGPKLGVVCKVKNEQTQSTLPGKHDGKGDRNGENGVGSLPFKEGKKKRDYLQPLGRKKNRTVRKGVEFDLADETGETVREEKDNGKKGSSYHNSTNQSYHSGKRIRTISEKKNSRH